MVNILLAVVVMNLSFRTKETLASGNFLSVINVLMQLRKVCNHPNLFEPRPTVSPFMMEGLCYNAPSIVWGITDYDPFTVRYILMMLYCILLMLNGHFILDYVQIWGGKMMKQLLQKYQYY